MHCNKVNLDKIFIENNIAFGKGGSILGRFTVISMNKIHIKHSADFFSKLNKANKKGDCYAI